MFAESSKRSAGRLRRKLRVRKKVSGTASRPRLNVYKSLKNIYAQVINDELGITLASASSLDNEIREVKAKKMDCAGLVGALIAKRCKEKEISEVVFDRNGYKYHGRVKAVAESAREQGLSF